MTIFPGVQKKVQVEIDRVSGCNKPPDCADKPKLSDVEAVLKETHGPMTFPPERFPTTPIHTSEPDPRIWTFGYGWRACLGRYIADNALLVNIAPSLAMFTISKVVPGGEVLKPILELEPGVISRSMPYQTHLTPRSREHGTLIRRVEVAYPWGGSDSEALMTGSG